jgi:chromosome segregation ATPase
VEIDTWIPVITGVVSSIGTWVVTRGSNKKDLQINRQQQLSKDEQEFRKELRDELKSHRDQVSHLTARVTDLHDINLKQQITIQNLEDKIDDLTLVNIKLETENRELNVKVDELMNKLSLFHNKSSGDDTNGNTV